MVSRFLLYGGGLLAAGLILVFGGVPGGAPPPPPPDFQSFEVMMKLALLNGDLPGARGQLEEHREHFEGQLKFELLEGWLLDREGDLLGAREAYREALSQARNDAQRHEILCSLGDLARRNGRSLDGWKCLEEAENVTGKTHRSRELRILLHFTDGRLNDALSEARLLAEENPDSKRAQRLREGLEKRAAVDADPPPATRSGAREAR